MSPMRYLWLRQMHFARRALRMADPAATTVTDIATSYGFWELGRFSVAYRSLFGESPSAAIRRPPKTLYRKKSSARPGTFRNLHSQRRATEPILGVGTFPVGIVASRTAGLIRLACRKRDAWKRHEHLYRFR
jgi:AraC-like DNA-binding protein